MQTRSQTNTAEKNPLVEFDFDEASRNWSTNKIKLGNGCYEYNLRKSDERSKKQHYYNTRSRIVL
jgi:hypothetical protein